MDIMNIKGKDWKIEISEIQTTFEGILEPITYEVCPYIDVMGTVTEKGDSFLKFDINGTPCTLQLIDSNIPFIEAHEVGAEVLIRLYK